MLFYYFFLWITYFFLYIFFFYFIIHHYSFVLIQSSNFLPPHCSFSLLIRWIYHINFVLRSTDHQNFCLLFTSLFFSFNFFLIVGCFWLNVKQLISIEQSINTTCTARACFFHCAWKMPLKLEDTYFLHNPIIRAVPEAVSPSTTNS